MSSPNPPLRSPRRATVIRRAAVLSPAVVLGLALLGSLAVHLPIYAGLGALADRLLARDSATPNPPSTLEFTVGPASEEEAETAPTEAPTRPEPARPAPRPRARAVRVPAPVPTKAPPEPVPTVPTPPTPQPPPPELDQRRAIVQRSQDPNVQSPDDARFLAEEAQDVEEETVAEVTNTLRDDPATRMTESQTSAADERTGDSQEDERADLRDIEGDDRRRVTRAESERERRDRAEADPSVSPTPSAVGGESIGESSSEPPRRGEPTPSARAGAVARGGGVEVGEEVVVSDGIGSFRVRAPRAGTEGTGGGEGGGVRTEGRGVTRFGDGNAGALARRTPGGAREGHGSAASGGVQVGLSWAQFEAVYGEERLERERTARLEERRSRSRGANRERRWQEFRSAIENYVSEVKPGNQTALDAAASPFATFLSDMHRRIHREYVDRYIAGLPLDAGEPQNDMNLNATLEIAVNPDGTVHRVGIVATSGNILFDFGAFNAVMAAQPFPRPPSSILSGDGHAWLHWRFDRGPRQCGTWNAQPFMLNNAPLHDRGEPTEEG